MVVTPCINHNAGAWVPMRLRGILLPDELVFGLMSDRF